MDSHHKWLSYIYHTSIPHEFYHPKKNGGNLILLCGDGEEGNIITFDTSFPGNALMVFGIERSNYYPFECPSCPNNTIRIEPLYDPVPTCLRNLSHFSSPLNYEIGPLGERRPGPVGITLGKALCLLKDKRAEKKSLYMVARNRL